MKKIILLVAATLLTFMASAVTYMRIKTFTDQDIKFNTKKVEQVDYEKDAATAKRYMRTKTSDGKTYTYDLGEITNVDYVDANLKLDTTGTAAQGVTVDGQIEGHTFVDLGLKSGLLWATYNVGATKPTEYGQYFSWGETSSKIFYTWPKYHWCDGSATEINKYCKNSSYGTVDSLGILFVEDDAIAANWGSVWRMPTIDEFKELNEGCEWEWTNDYKESGIAGYIATSKTNHNTIFFPAAGVMNNLDIVAKNTYGRYWATNISSKRSDHALFFRLENGEHSTNTSTARCYGLSARAVAKISVEKYTVRFFAADSSLLESKNVINGAPATTPEAPDLKGYMFIGWSDSSFTNVQDNLDIYAQYAENPKVDGVTISGEADGYTYVDLGLKSGIWWATNNVGATTPHEYGDKFEWGETSTREKSSSWSDYKWCEGSNNSLTKYCTNKANGTVDGLKTLELEDDAVNANWGNTWRMPASDELVELAEGCDWKFTDDFNGTGVAGYIGTSIANGNVIFLPSFDASTSYGYYWSSNVAAQTSNNAYIMTFGNDKSIEMADKERHNIYNVRGVKAKHFTVNFFTADSILIESQQVEKGKSATEPVAPEIENYVFVGWSSTSFSDVQKDMNIYAKYKQIIFTVNFFLNDSTLIETHKAKANEQLTAPAVEEIAGYNFMGWSDSSFTEVQKDINTYAVYKKIATEEGLTITGKAGEYSYVDLGLSVLWATQNVGAKPNKATDFGGYYAWGETEEKKTYYPKNYKWSDTTKTIPFITPETPMLTKYSSADYGEHDGISKLLPEDDAATVNMGGAWRTPTKNELNELMQKCKWTWTTINGVGGCLITSKVEGYTDNSIFIPSAGFKQENMFYNEQDRIILWSSEVNTSRNWLESFNLNYMKGISFEIFNTGRYEGYNVRAVIDKSNVE